MTFRENIECYLSSLIPIINLHNTGIISKNDFDKAEEYLAKKYCIKEESLYRSYDLINNAFRVINSVPKKEVKNNGNKGNENKCITKI